MEIKVGQKWVALKTLRLKAQTIAGDDFIFNIGDRLTITQIEIYSSFPYWNESIPLTKDELLDNFILLSEWREIQINSILDGD